MGCSELSSACLVTEHSLLSTCPKGVQLMH